MEGLLLDSRGRVEGSSTAERVRAALARGADPERREKFDEILENLRRGAAEAGPFERRAAQYWREPLYITVADGAQILNTVTETILVPDFTVPAGYAYQGKTLKYTLMGDASFVITTPGTWTLALRWGGVAGTVLATSAAIAPDPTAAQTTRSWCVEWWVTFRGVGTAAAAATFGKIWLSDVDDASATTLQGNLNSFIAPTNAWATVSIDTTTAKALSPTAKHSVSTATTQTTCHMAILESIA